MDFFGNSYDDTMPLRLLGAHCRCDCEGCRSGCTAGTIIIEADATGASSSSDDRPRNRAERRAAAKQRRKRR